MKAREPLWRVLNARTVGDVRQVLASVGERATECLGALQVIAAAAESAGLTDVAAAAAQRLEIAERGIALGDRLRIAPVAAKRLPELAKALREFATLAGVAGYGHTTYAEWACRMACDLYARLEGPRSRNFILTLGSLTAICTLSGHFEEAIRSGTQAWELSQEVGGFDVEDEAGVMINLGLAWSHLGRWDEAAHAYGWACSVLAALATEAETYGLALNNLGAVQVKRGQFAEAKDRLQEALAIRRDVLGQRHPAVAETLMNLAFLASDLGYSSGTLYQEALDIRRAAWHGIDHPLIAQSESSLGSALIRMGRISAGRQLGEDALAMRRRLFGDTPHPDLAESLNNVASEQATEGNLDKAEKLWEECIAVMKAAVGDAHSDLASPYSGLALLYAATGRHEQARVAAEAAVDVTVRAYGEKHHDVANRLASLAYVLALAGNRSGALDALRKAIGVQDATFWRVMRMSSAYGRALYAAATGGLSDAFLSLVLSQDQIPPEDELREAADLVLRRKHLEGEMLVAQRDALRSPLHADLAEIAHALANVRREIARLELAGDNGDPDHHQDALLEAGLAREELEADLAARIPELDRGAQLRSVTAADFASRLPVGTALIEIMRITDMDTRPGPERFTRQWAGSRYIAVVLRPGDDRARVLVIGDAEAIDEMIDGFRSAIISGELEAGVGAALYGQVVAPLIDAVGDASRILIAPDGDFFELPFDAVPLGHGRRLIGIWETTYLTCGRDLLRTPAAPTGNAGPALVVADPDFTLGEPGPSSRKRAFDCSGLAFNRLLGTRREGTRVAAAIGADAMMGPQALEGALKARRSPRILHIATHGFFLPPVEEAPHVGDGDRTVLSRALRPNPLLRSGLLLAGAQVWCRGGTPPAEAEDGLLTAEDVASLDLLDTELVVLSACESGLGQVQAGEGVHGLRRAFELAGSRALVMSLWKVGDEVTEVLMTRFYQALRTAVEPSAALRSAQRSLLEEHPDEPLLWAAFVYQGVPGTTTPALPI